jgi:hypothetical protein
MTLIRLTSLLAVAVSIGGFTSQARAAAKCPKIPDGFNVLIRSDFTDLGPFGCTHDAIDSQGATVSGANNLLTKQNSTSLDGLVAFDYTKYYGAKNLYLMGYSFGAYVQGDDTYQFQPTSTQSWNGYAMTPGLFGEVDLANTLGNGGVDALRVHGGQVIGSTGTRYYSIVGEWIPTDDLGFVQLNEAMPLFNNHLLYTFAPEIMAQYDQFDVGPKTPALFLTNNEAFRIGPEVLMIFRFQQGWLPKGLAALENMSLQATNHESWDQYTGKEYVWTAFALNYTFTQVNSPGLPPDKQKTDVSRPLNLTPSFGLSLSYGFGNSETTGNQTRQVKLGLAVKL